MYINHKQSAILDRSFNFNLHWNCAFIAACSVNWKLYKKVSFLRNRPCFIKKTIPIFSLGKASHFLVALLATNVSKIRKSVMDIIVFNFANIFF